MNNIAWKSFKFKQEFLVKENENVKVCLAVSKTDIIIFLLNIYNIVWDKTNKHSY